MKAYAALDRFTETFVQCVKELVHQRTGVDLTNKEEGNYLDFTKGPVLDFVERYGGLVSQGALNNLTRVGVSVRDREPIGTRGTKAYEITLEQAIAELKIYIPRAPLGKQSNCDVRRAMTAMVNTIPTERGRSVREIEAYRVYAEQIELLADITDFSNAVLSYAPLIDWRLLAPSYVDQALTNIVANGLPQVMNHFMELTRSAYLQPPVPGALEYKQNYSKLIATGIVPPLVRQRTRKEAHINMLETIYGQLEVISYKLGVEIPFSLRVKLDKDTTTRIESLEALKALVYRRNTEVAASFRIEGLDITGYSLNEVYTVKESDNTWTLTAR